MNVRGLTFALGLAVCVITIITSALQPTLATRTTDGIQDAFQRAAPRVYDPQSPVHIIDIDQAALDSFGQWPWPRSYLAQLNQRLFEHGAAVVGYDILFAEDDRTSPEQITQSWTRFGGHSPKFPDMPRHDALFAQAIAQHPTVLAVAGAPNGDIPRAKAGISFTGDPPKAALNSWPGALDNLAELQSGAAGLGVISLGRGADGIVRAVPMVSAFNGTLLPALSAEVLRVAQGAGGYILRTAQASGEGVGGGATPTALQIGAFQAPLDARGRFRVHFAGTQPERVTSAVSVLERTGYDPALEAAIAGKIILVGSSAQGLFDIRSTPLSNQVAGVALHAEVLEQILSGHFLTRPDWARGAEVLAVMLLCLLLTLVLLRQNPILSLLVAGLAAALPTTLSYLAFGQGLLIDPLWATLATVLLYVPGTTIGIVSKERARRAVRDRFAFFLPPALIAQIADDPDQALTPQGADRELSVIFVDMRGFTTLSEHMAPADVVALVNTFLSAVSDALIAKGATIDKFMGDAVMAFWNAPIALPDHETQACAAIPAIEAAVQQANGTLAQRGLPNMQVAIGLNTGLCQVGLMGSNDRLSYTCIGDSVTLAARLEGLTRIYGVGNCAGPNSVGALPEDLIGPVLDMVAVKGRSQPIPVHSVVAKTPNNHAAMSALACARDAFLARDWDLAEDLFRELGALSLDDWPLSTLSALYLRRISSYRDAPPAADWQGVFVATSKS